MDKAKAAVSEFTSGHGHHHTTVDESVNRPVTREQVKPVRSEQVTEAVDREVHQDHHHTTIQPIQHREVLPEQHTHNPAPVQHREFEHDNHEQTRQRLDNERAQFQDTSTTHDTHHTSSAAPTVEGEHTHHHVHERVQPVIQKETVQPEVVHTTVPIHETHHAGAEHHGISALPTKTMDEIRSQAGGHGERDLMQGSGEGVTAREQYEGKPRPYNKDLETTMEKVLHPGGHHGGHQGQHEGHQGAGGVGSNTSERYEEQQGAGGLGQQAAGTGLGAGGNTNGRF